MSEFFRIRTFHQTCLHRLPSGEICHLHPGQSLASLPEVLAFAPSAASTEIVLVADSEADQAVGMRPDVWANPLYPMRRVLQRDGSFGLAHPYSGHLALALPLEGGDERPHCVYSDNLTAQGWESFTFEPVQPASPGTVRRGAAAAQAAALAGQGMQTLLAPPAEAAMIETVARLVPQSDFELTAQRFAADPAFAASVLAAAGDSPFAVALRNLLATSPAAPVVTARRGLFRRKVTQPAYQVDNVNDGRFAALANTTHNSRFTSAFDKLSATARRHRLPRRRLCAITTARNEGAYLLEWVAYHRTLGVEHFFIGSNDNDDGSDALLAALDAAGVISWVANTGATSDVQIKAYRHVLAINPDVLDYDWAILIDVDEFVTLRPGGLQTIPDFIAWQEHQPVDVIALCWSVHWSSGHVRWADDPVIARFRRQNHGASLVKSILRPRLFTYAHPHHPLGFDNTVGMVARDGLGDRITYPRGRMTGPELPDARYGEAWINHYFSKSAEEFLWKWARSEGIRGFSSFADVPDDFMRGFVGHHASEEKHVPDAMEAHLASVAAEMAALLRLPGVDRAVQGVLQHRRDHAKETMALARSIDQSGLDPAKQAFLALLTG